MGLLKQSENDNDDLTISTQDNSGLDLENAVPAENSFHNDSVIGEGKVNTGVISNPSAENSSEIPDGGYGWAVAVAGFLANFIMFGTLSIFGVISQAYSTTILEGKSTTLQFMGIGCLVAVATNIFTPVTILLIRFGARFNYALGSTLMCLSLIFAGFSYEVWHLYLSQGILFGFGASFLYMSVSSIIPQWFNKRRATAMGLCSSGTGLGGLALSPFMNSLIMKYGISGAYRILGYFSLGVCAVGTILIKDRLPSAHRKTLPIKSPIQLSMLKEANFNIWLVGAVIALMGYTTPLFYLPKYAASIGLDSTDSANLLAILCAMSAVGRVGLGFIGDKIGRLNMLVISSLLSGLYSFVIWPFASTYNILLLYCILWAPGAGMYYGLAAPITATVVGMEKLGSGLSILFVVSSIAAVGAPIAAAIEVESGYFGVQMFVGSVYVGGGIMSLFEVSFDPFIIISILRLTYKPESYY